MEQEFRYEIDVPRTRHTDAVLREGLRRFGERVGGRVFTIKEFDAWRGRPFAAGTVVKRFGTWHAALKSIGIDGAKRRRVPREELLEDFERVWRELGRPPGEHTLSVHGRYSCNAYNTRWGSVARFAKMVSAMHRGEMSREDLLAYETPRKPQREVSIITRWTVLKRDRYRCVACGRTPTTDPNVELEVDHILAVSRGGGNSLDNLRTLCRECNRGKGANR